MSADEKSDRWTLDELRIELSRVGGGAYAYTAFSRNTPYPVGTVWVHASRNAKGESVAFIVDIYVPETYRRRGVARRMLSTMLDTYGLLKTHKGTDAGGMALMTAMGWKCSEDTGEWYLRKPE